MLLPSRLEGEQKSCAIQVGYLLRVTLLALIRVYRYFLSPYLGAHCRFYPSCSRYAEQAIKTHGALQGSYLSITRLLRCHPWHPGGIDPVPEKDKQAKWII